MSQPSPAPAQTRRAGRPLRDDDLHLALLAEVATSYYIDKLNQEQIGKQLGRSVSMVSRLLAEAHERGVVEVRVCGPVPTDTDLQTALMTTFGLRTARVLRTAGLDPARLLARLGQLAARYVETILRDGAVVGIGWGTALYEVVQAITPGAATGIKVAQSLGSLGSRRPAIDNHLLTQQLAARLGGTPHYLPSPMIVESEAVRDVLVQDSQLQQTLALGRRADVMLVGIGVPEPEHAGLLQAGYLDAATLEAIRAVGAVGDVFVNYFDRGGNLCDIELSRRVVGVRLEDLRDVGTAVAVAGGVYKAHAILGAVRTGLLHVLIVDDLTAAAMLALAGDEPAPMVEDGLEPTGSGQRTTKRADVIGRTSAAR